MVETSQDMIWRADEEGRITYLNPAWKETLGYDTEEMLGRRFGDFKKPAEAARTIEFRKKVLSSTKVTDYETYYISQSGQEISIIIRAKPSLDSSGNFVGTQGTAQDITERKRAEEAKRESEDLLSIFFEVAPLQLAVKDRDGRYVSVNKNWCEFFETTPEAVLGRLPTEISFWPKEQGLQIYQEDQRTMLAGTLEIPEQSWVDNSGGTHWAQILKVPIKGKEGKNRGLVTLALQITDRKQSEIELRLHSEIVSHMRGGVIFVRVKDAVVVYTTPNFEKMFGYEPGELLEKRVIVLIASGNKTPEETAEEIIKSIANKGWWQGEVHNVKKDGTRFWTTAFISEIEHSQFGRVWLSVQHDITEQKQVQEALWESKALLDAYFTRAPAGMGLFDTELRYVKLNGTLADINGLSIEDHFHKRPSEILPGTLGVAVEERFENLLRTGQSIINEEISGETLSQPGVTRHWVHSFFPIFGAGKRAKGIGAIVLEITKIKLMEEQLRQSQKMEALGTMAGGIAHDFNNILMPIIGFTDLLLENLEAESEEYSYLTTIAESAHRGAKLVSHILLFSRNSRTEKRVCDIVPVSKEVIKLMRSTLPITIAIEEKVSKDQAPVFCDPSQMHQVILNLCVNAGQAISGIGKIKIDLNTLDLNGFECFDGTKLFGRHVRLAVTDSGVGMNKETLSQIFDPFFTTKEVGKGTGLGLSTVFGIVHDHKGGIAVSSEPGKGTTFEVFLPFAESNIEKLPDTLGAVRAIGSENILFVDDEEAITKLGRIFLERLGYNVTAVSDGQQALEIFAANPERFNLVLTDQTMPNMTGETLAHELLNLRPDIPIILFTGHSGAISPERSKAIGISSFLYKPIAPKELGRVVREVLDQAKEASPRS